MEEGKQYEWHKIAESEADIGFSANGLAELEVVGKKVCIARYEQNLRACAHQCPHAGAKLHQGYLDPQGNIVCPLHRYKFSLKNGLNISGEGYFLKTHPLEIREEGVFIGFVKNKGFSF